MRDRAIQIGGRKVGAGQPPFIIAEMSGNHNRSLERALRIVDEAAAAGAHAIKLQTYTADTMTLDIPDGEFLIRDPESPWDGYTLYDLYDVAHTPWEWHGPIFERCRELGLICFSTPFDASSVDFLESLGVPAYKVASFENTDIPLLKKVASTGKPVLLSTGMVSVSELVESVETLRAGGCDDIVLLKCTSSYPAGPEDSNLLTIPHMRKMFGVQAGISDHTLGIGAALAAVALGATVIEKHFTLRREYGGVDAEFSMEPAELRQLCEEAERAWLSLGRVSYGAWGREKKSPIFRRSLYVARDMDEGESFTPDNLRPVRPGFGLPTKHYQDILGRRIARAAKKGTPVSWEIIA